MLMCPVNDVTSIALPKSQTLSQIAIIFENLRCCQPIFRCFIQEGKQNVYAVIDAPACERDASSVLGAIDIDILRQQPSRH